MISFYFDRLTIFTIIIRNQWRTWLVGIFFLEQKIIFFWNNWLFFKVFLSSHQIIFFGLGANETDHWWTCKDRLVNVVGRRSGQKHVVRKSERTLKQILIHSDSVTLQRKFNKTNYLPICFLWCWECNES